MKLIRIFSFAAPFLVLASACNKSTTASSPTKNDHGKKAARQAAKAAAQYDKNSDGVISGDESAALRKAFEANKTGPLKAFDLNADGTLDDNEIAAIHIGKHGKGGKGGKKKTNAT